jgi:hypothetical protein
MLTPDECKLLLRILDKAPIQGIPTMFAVIQIAEKLKNMIGNGEKNDNKQSGNISESGCSSEERTV